MVSSGLSPNNGIDRSVGGLVWVCRRNGSWWPGQIVSQDDLPEICLLTPRSGTPVKLLGRENAIVDWYNLEKSKRIKAFRCGEYDDCIKKAMRFAPQICRKGVKYARKEDAILHALKLESVCLEKEYSDFYAMYAEKDKEEQHVKDSPSSSHSMRGSQKVEHLNSSKDDLAPAPALSQFEGQDHVVATTTVSKHISSPNDSEDSGARRVKRTRGIGDIGAGSVSSLKRKASQVSNVHVIMKRKNRQRTLAKVLERSTIVPVLVGCDELSCTESAAPISVSNFSGLESNESKISNSGEINKSDTAELLSENVMPLNTSTHISDVSRGSSPKENSVYCMKGIPENLSFECLFDVPLVAEENDSAGFPSYLSCSSLNVQQVGTEAESSQRRRLEAMSFENEDDEYGCTSSGTAGGNGIHPKIGRDVPDWQFKRKRNSRLRKIYIKGKVEACVAPSINGKMHNSQNLDSDRARRPPLMSENIHVKSKPLAEIEEFCGWSWNAPQGTSGQDVASSGLCDVNVEVETSYRPQHVSYISLPSRVHGEPIIGQPVSVEVMDAGACDILYSYSECNNVDSKLNYNLTKIHQWRINGTKHHSPPERRSRKKSSRNRKSSLLSKKIRKLSSLTGACRLSRAEKQPLVGKVTDPAIACIPLKVVFSRINAALNRPMRPTPHVAET